jgi:peptide/nickel transport system ATP-binding protein
MLEVTDLSIAYRALSGDVLALKNATFSVADGEIMGLAGESGSGKSTLGKSLIKLEQRMKHLSGSVRLDGETLPIDDDRAMIPFRFKRVSIVPQYAMSALNPTRRIGHMIAELVASRGLDFGKVRPELERRLTLVDLPVDLLGRYPIELSGGQKQRIVTVISTLLDPSLLIADEITSALDVSTQKAVARSLVEFRDRGFIKSAIVITHDLSILAQMADTILVMHNGRLVERAPVRTIVDNPLHPYTRHLIGSLPEVGVRYADKKLAGVGGLNAAIAAMASDEGDIDRPLREMEPGHWVASWGRG